MMVKLGDENKFAYQLKTHFNFRIFKQKPSWNKLKNNKIYKLNFKWLI